MNIVIIGETLAGLVAAGSYAEFGCRVQVTSITASDQNLVINEPGLQALLSNNMQANRLQTLHPENIDWHDVDLIFIATHTVISADGTTDIQPIITSAQLIAENCSQNVTVGLMSSAPIGTCEQIAQTINRTQQGNATGSNTVAQFEIVSTPEFIKEGSAIEDFMRPDRIILGKNEYTECKPLIALMKNFCRQEDKLLIMPTRDAEMIKFAANAMLATRISLMNEMAALADFYDIDIENVRRGIGSDKRIGAAFIYPGCGFGGRYFPKDLDMLDEMTTKADLHNGIVGAVRERNHLQKRLPYDLLLKRFGANLTGKKIALWGLSFKPNTDDVCGASSVELIRLLSQAGADIVAYDPVVSIEKMRDAGINPDQLLKVSNHQYDAIDDADALILVTEWKPFRQPDFNAMSKLMKSKVIIDGRNQYDPQLLRDMGFEYHGIGRR